MSDQEQEANGRTAERVVEALERGTRQLDALTLSRLYDSRRQAVSALHAHHAGRGLLALRQHPGLAATGLASALLLGAWFALQPAPSQRPGGPDTSELDIQLLTGDLPPQVFADWSLVTQESVDAVCLTDS